MALNKPTKFILFVVILAVLYLLIGLPAIKLFQGHICGAAGAFTNWIISRFEPSRHLGEGHLLIKGRNLNIKLPCLGINFWAFFCICVICYPTDKRKKIVGLLSGLFILTLAVVLRLVLLAVVFSNEQKDFQVYHRMWNPIYITLLILTWIGWVNWADNVKEKSQ